MLEFIYFYGPTMDHEWITKVLNRIQGPFGRSPNGPEPPPARCGFVRGAGVKREREDSSEQLAVLQ